MIDPSVHQALAEADQSYAQAATVFGDSVVKLAAILPHLEELAGRRVGPGDQDQTLANMAIYFAVLVVKTSQAGVLRGILEQAIKGDQEQVPA